MKKQCSWILGFPLPQAGPVHPGHGLDSAVKALAIAGMKSFHVLALLPFPQVPCPTFAKRVDGGAWLRHSGRSIVTFVALQLLAAAFITAETWESEHRCE